MLTELVVHYLFKFVISYFLDSKRFIVVAKRIKS